MAAIFNSPSKYIQGPDELAKLGSYVEPLGLSLGKTTLDLGTDALLARRRHDDEGLSAERLDIGAELGELVRTLDVLAGAIENCSHNYPIL